MASRIASVAAGVPDQLRKLDDDELRDIARKSARWAVARSDVQDPAVDSGLRHLESGSQPQEARAAVEEAVERLDQVAWDTQELVDAGDAPEEDYLTAFARARAAAAVQYALAEDPTEAAIEAMYEAQAADGSIDELLAELGLA